LYLECLLAEKKFSEIDEFFSSLDEEMKNNKEIIKVIKKINITKDSKISDSIELMIAKYNKNSKNIRLVCEISDFYFSEGDYDSAFSFLLDSFHKDKEKIKKKLVDFFEALGNEHDATKTYRKKLSSLLFS